MRSINNFIQDVSWGCALGIGEHLQYAIVIKVRRQAGFLLLGRKGQSLCLGSGPERVHRLDAARLEQYASAAGQNLDIREPRAAQR